MDYDINDLNPTGMFGRVELVTPDRARRDLESMAANRAVRTQRLDRYAKARQEGRWVLHHQGIAYNTRGQVIDGEHRLKMVVRTGLPTVFWVVYNVPDVGRTYVDDNLPRSIRDGLRMAGEGDYSCSLISTATAIEGPPAALPNRSRDRADVLRLLRQYAGALDFVEPRLGKVFGVTRAVRAVTARAWICLGIAGRGRLGEWCVVIKDGLTVSEDKDKDRAAIVYRNWLMENARLSGSLIEMDRYRKGQSALDAFLDCRPLTKLYGSERDLFPLPAGDDIPCACTD